MQWLAIVFALLSALLFAVAVVAQQKAASEVPEDEAKGTGLILQLIKRPLWWAGTIGDVGGYGAQAAALAFGSLLVVQPIITAQLLFALPLAAAWVGRRLARSDWFWAVVLTAALVVFLLVGEPTAGIDIAPFRDWLLIGGGLVAVSLIALGVAAAMKGVVRAAAFAVSAGILYAITAALTKSVDARLDDGLASLLTFWELHVAILTGIVGTVVLQSAFHAGSLGASLPIVTVLEPLVAALIGLTVFQEALQAEGFDWVLVGISVLAMGAATIALSRSAARQAAELDTSTAPSPDASAATRPTGLGTNSDPSPGMDKKPSAPA